MAHSNLSHRRTHNLLLISKLLNQRDAASPFTLVLDSLEQPAKPLITDYLRRADVSFETSGLAWFTFPMLLLLPRCCYYYVAATIMSLLLLCSCYYYVAATVHITVCFDLRISASLIHSSPAFQVIYHIPVLPDHSTAQ